MSHLVHIAHLKAGFGTYFTIIVPITNHINKKEKGSDLEHQEK